VLSQNLKTSISFSKKLTHSPTPKTCTNLKIVPGTEILAPGSFGNSTVFFRAEGTRYNYSTRPISHSPILLITNNLHSPLPPKCALLWKSYRVPEYYRNTLKKEITGLENSIRSKIPKRLPVVLTRTEIEKIFSCMQYPYILMVSIIYGGGLRLQECLSLRVKDINIERNCISIIAGKGNKDKHSPYSQLHLHPC